MNNKFVPYVDFDFDFFDLESINKECAKRGWDFSRIQELAGAVNRIKILNPSAPISRQKISYRGSRTHCGTKHCRENFK